MLSRYHYTGDKGVSGIPHPISQFLLGKNYAIRYLSQRILSLIRKSILTAGGAMRWCSVMLLLMLICGCGGGGGENVSNSSSTGRWTYDDPNYHVVLDLQSPDAAEHSGTIPLSDDATYSGTIEYIDYRISPPVKSVARIGGTFVNKWKYQTADAGGLAGQVISGDTLYVSLWYDPQSQNPNTLGCVVGADRDGVELPDSEMLYLSKR